MQFNQVNQQRACVVKHWLAVVVQLLTGSVCVLLLQMACREVLISSRYICGVLHVFSTPSLPPSLPLFFCVVFFCVFSTDQANVTGARACGAHGWVLGICQQWSSLSGRWPKWRPLDIPGTQPPLCYARRLVNTELNKIRNLAMKA